MVSVKVPPSIVEVFLNVLPNPKQVSLYKNATSKFGYL